MDLLTKVMFESSIFYLAWSLSFCNFF